MDRGVLPHAYDIVSLISIPKYISIIKTSA